MSALFDSVVTVLLITLLGWALMRFNVVQQEQWNGFERVSFQVFFPAVVIHSLVTADLSSVPALRFGAALLGAVLLTGAILHLARPLLLKWLSINDPSFSSVLQGAIRWNTFMAVSIVGLMHGGRGLTLVAVAIVAIIPLINVWSVFMLRRYGEGHAGSFSVLDLLKNPFIWSSLVGLALNFTGLRPPAQVLAAVDICGKAALAAALLLVGSGLRLADLGRPGAAVVFSSAAKLLFLPLVAAVLGYFLGLSGTDMSVLLICASVPTAGAGYIMARQMGGDARLMAAIITFETIASISTIPLVQWLFFRS